MIEEQLITNLKPHPQNSLIYGDSFDKDLLDSIKKHGMDTPVKITLDGTIISGHRRFAACEYLGFETIAVQEIDETDPDKLLELLIANNIQREKTNAMKAREFKVLKAIEEKRAKERLGGHHKDNSTVEKLPQLEAQEGKSRDIAAAKVGWSGKTAESAERVVNMIDAIKESEPEKAAAIEKKLNESVSGAERIIKPKEVISPQNKCTEAMQFATIAISQLERIRKDDPVKVKALNRVMTWINTKLKE